MKIISLFEKYHSVTQCRCGAPATKLRRQIGVILTIADRVISGERGTTQRELYRVAKALEKHLPVPALTADEKLFDIRAELHCLYVSLNRVPEKAPEHYARLVMAVEEIIGRKEAVSAKPEAIYPSILTQQAEAHYPPMKVEETDGAKAQREKSEQFALVRSMPTHCPKCNSTNFIKSGNGWRCGGSFGDGCGWGFVIVEEVPRDRSTAAFDKLKELLRAAEKERDDLKGRLEQSATKNKDLNIESNRLAESLHRAISERDDLKARLAHYEDAYRRIDVFIAQNKELLRKADGWERLSKEHETARNLLQREVDRLTRERDQLREDLSNEFSRMKKIREALGREEIT